MSTVKVFAVAVGLLAFALPLGVGGADSGEGTGYTLEFLPTHNAPVGAGGTMHITLTDAGESRVRLKVRGLYPNTVYTIWTVFNKLTWKPGDTGPASEPSKVASTNPAAGFPAEGNGVSPTARTDRGFTDGMGLDQGATFVTDENGDGQVKVRLNYDVIDAAPVSNKDIIGQCVTGPDADSVKDAGCYPKRKIRITTTYLRKFVNEYPVAQRAAMCANYDPSFDPDVTGYSASASHGTDARFWQCVDPATGLPRIDTFAFDHFRLADHPDGLTHGFIGGNGADHFIDMVGRRCDLVPSVGATCD